MENHQMFFLSSPPLTSSPVDTDRDMSGYSPLSLFAHFHGNNTSRDDHRDQMVKQAVDFEGGRRGYDKFHDDDESGTTSNNYDGEATNDKAKSETKKGENKSKRHKFAFQTRSQVDVLDDGYRWRKYGQKIVKNSKFPRSYYKCTFQGCNVKKQIQRLCVDEGVVVTTYEGMHSHSIEKSAENFSQMLKHIQTSYGTTF